MKNRTRTHRIFLTFFVEELRYGIAGDDMKATQLEQKQYAKVSKITLAQEAKKRLFYLGVYEGATIQFLHTAPLHDPYLFQVQDCLLCIRAMDANEIEVEPVCVIP